MILGRSDEGDYKYTFSRCKTQGQREAETNAETAGEGCICPLIFDYVIISKADGGLGDISADAQAPRYTATSFDHA